MNEQTIYLVRHAQSTLSGRYCGSTDAGLSALGFQQAKKVGVYFRGVEAELCFYSGMKRARLTANFIRRNGTPLLRATQMREINFGKWERKKFSTVEKGWPAIYKKWVESPTSVNLPSGEPFASFCGRVKTFSRKLLKHTEKNIVIVAHGGSLSVLSMILLRKPISHFWKCVPPPASISILKRSQNGRSLNGKMSPFRVVRLKDCSHLEN